MAKKKSQDTRRNTELLWKPLAMLSAILPFVAGYTVSGIQFLYQFSWIFALLLALGVDSIRVFRKPIARTEPSFLGKLILMMLTTFVVFSFMQRLYFLAYTGDPISLMLYAAHLLSTAIVIDLLYRALGIITGWNVLKFFSWVYAIAAVLLASTILCLFSLLVYIISLLVSGPRTINGLLGDVGRDFQRLRTNIRAFSIVIVVVMFLWCVPAVFGQLFGRVMCDTNLHLWHNNSNAVLIYGPQELLVSFGDTNEINVLRPWFPVVVDKNKLCAAEIRVVTALGEAPCYTLAVCR